MLLRGTRKCSLLALLSLQSRFLVCANDVLIGVSYRHVVEYMYVSAVGILLGADLGWAGYFGKCLAPITLGNTIGGALFTGVYQWFVFMECEKRGWSAEAKDGDEHEENGRLTL